MEMRLRDYIKETMTKTLATHTQRTTQKPASPYTPCMPPLLSSHGHSSMSVGSNKATMRPPKQAKASATPSSKAQSAPAARKRERSGREQSFAEVKDFRRKVMRRMLAL